MSDPDASRSDGNVCRRPRRAEGADQLARLRIDLRDRAVVGVDDPDAALADGDSRRGRPQRHAIDDVARLGIESERARRSVIPRAFWYFSIAGSVTLLAYALYRRDPVFIVSQLPNSLIYLRNIWLLARERRADLLS